MFNRSSYHEGYFLCHAHVSIFIKHFFILAEAVKLEIRINLSANGGESTNEPTFVKGEEKKRSKNFQSSHTIWQIFLEQ